MKDQFKIPCTSGMAGAKPVLGIYVINDEGKLRFRKISRLMIPYYRTRLWKRRIMFCLDCGSRFMGFVKKETDELLCPYCS